MRVVPVTSSSDQKAVTGASTTFDTTMAAGEYWVFTTTIAAYIQQGAAPVATAGDTSTLIGAGQSCLIDGLLGAKLAVIRASAPSGEATLTRAKID